MDSLLIPLKRSVQIVKGWGKVKLPHGKTLEEQFTFGDFSFWEVISPVIGLYYVPMALTGDSCPPSFFQLARPHISLAKRRFLHSIQRFKLKDKPIDKSIPFPFLFLGFNAYMYHDVLKPVVLNLEKRSFKTLTLYEGKFSPQKNEEDNSHFQSIWQNWDKDLNHESRELSCLLRKAVQELKEMNIFPDIFKTEDKSLWPHMRQATQWLFHFHLPLLVPQVVAARRILKMHRPSVVFSSDVADPRNRIYVILARALGISSLEVQLGPNGEDGVEWQFMASDRVATWGKTTSQALSQHGLTPEKIMMTGSPRHDSFVNLSPEGKSKTRTRLHISSETPMILCASTYQQKEYNALSDPELLKSMKLAVFDAADQTEGLVLVVKPHPLEDVEETRRLIGKRRNIILVDADDDIRELIKACDAFVAFGSTATVDALVAHKLTICPCFSNWMWSDIFVKSGATLVPRSVAEVENIFKSIMSSCLHELQAELEPARDLFLQKLVYKADGRASERVADMAIQMANY